VDIAQLDALTAPHMAVLEDEMTRILGHDHPTLDQLNRHIMQAPGKRLRPKLLLLCAKALDVPSERALTYGSVFELIHTATLIHDDIIDEARTRRGLKTLNAEIGNVLTVLYGDLLYTKAHRAACELGNLAVVATIDRISEQMIAGELLQNQVTFDLDIDQETYTDILESKTAWRFAGTAQVAGLIAEAEPAVTESLKTYGFEVGRSFQLIDDVLDYTATAAEMGKPVASDLLGGKVTLPAIWALNRDASLKDAIRELWDNEADELPAHLARAIHDAGGLEETKRLAEIAAHRAVAAIDALPTNPYATILRALPSFLLERIR